MNYGSCGFNSCLGHAVVVPSLVSCAFGRGAYGRERAMLSFFNRSPELEYVCTQAQER